MGPLNVDLLKTTLESIQSTSIQFSQLNKCERNSDVFNDIKQCFEIFLDLGKHLNHRMLAEIQNNQVEEVREVEKPERKELEKLEELKEIESTPEILHDKPEDMEKCSNCSLETVDLEGHNRENHLETKLICGQCPFTAIKKSNIQLHKQKNHQGITYPCSKCKFIAPNFVVLTGHNKLEHSKEEKKICIKCGFESSDIKEFKKHLKIVHAKTSKITQYRNS